LHEVCRRDTKHVIRDTYNERPFVLEGNTATERIHVEEPLMAQYLVDSLPVTHDRFEPNKANLLSRGLDRIFGDVSKGFEEKERLLPVGTSLLGYGRVTMEGGVKRLGPAEDARQPYILTTQTKRQVVQALQGSARLYRAVAVVLGVAGAGVLAYVLYKRYRRWHQTREMRALRREIEAGRTAGGPHAGSDAASRECVICLQNRREVIMLDCGHICTCFDCSQAIPEPKKCPVCRELVARIRNIYMP
jgi:E3 ubiquitin-protein ligase MUL1